MQTSSIYFFKDLHHLIFESKDKKNNNYVTLFVFSRLNKTIKQTTYHDSSKDIDAHNDASWIGFRAATEDISPVVDDV